MSRVDVPPCTLDNETTQVMEVPVDVFSMESPW